MDSPANAVVDGDTTSIGFIRPETSMQTRLIIQTLGACVLLASCKSVPRQVVHGVTFTPSIVSHGVAFKDSDIRARFILDGARLEYSVVNCSKHLFFVTEDPLNPSADGKLGADALSFVSGRYSGPSVSAMPRSVLLKPGEKFLVQVNLEKSYDNLNMTRSVVPEHWHIRTSAFESLSEAVKYWGSRELTKGGQTTPPPYIVARWRNK